MQAANRLAAGSEFALADPHSTQVDYELNQN